MMALKRKREPMVRPFKIRRVAGQRTGRLPYEVKLQLRRLNSANAKIRADAAERLGKMGNAAAVPELLRALRSRDTRVRVNASVALGRMGSAAVPGLIKVIKSTSRGSRLAANVLGDIKDPAAIPALLGAMKSKDTTLRAQAMLSLGFMREKAKDVVPALLNELKSGNPRTMGAAASALGLIKNPVAVPALLEGLKATNEPMLKIRIISALLDFEKAANTAGVVEHLTAVAREDPSVNVRNMAEYTLKRITGAKF